MSDRDAVRPGSGEEDTAARSAVGQEDEERAASRTWAEIAAVCGVLAVITHLADGGGTPSLGPALIVVCIFGSALPVPRPEISARFYGFTGQRRVSRIGVVANVAAGVAVTKTLFAQLAFKEWLDLSSRRTPRRDPHRPPIRQRTGSSSGST